MKKLFKKYFVISNFLAIAYLCRVKKSLKIFCFTFLFGAICCIPNYALAQRFDDKEESASENKEKPAKEKFLKKENVFVGGGLGGGFGNGAGMIQASPLVGYNITESFQTALKVTYTYIYGTEGLTTQRYSDHIIATSLINRYVVWKGIFLQVEPELMNRKDYYLQTNALGIDELLSKRINVFNLYVGGGAYMDFSSNSGGFILLLYNLNQTKNSFYRNPHIQAGFTFGF